MVRGVFGRAWAGVVVVVAACLVWGVGVASASLYGEVGRFGCFQAVYGCEGLPGEAGFATPVGFAVEADEAGPMEERNAVFVLEQQIGAGGPEYTLRKLKSPQTQDPGETLGKTGTYALGEGRALIGLAVDENEHRVYTLIENNGGSTLPTAYELIAWSSQPNGSGELEPAKAPEGTAAYKAEPALHAAVVAEFKAGEDELYMPESLAVEAGGGHDVAIEAQTKEGAPIIERVPTIGADAGHTGTANESNIWQARIQNNGEVPDGLTASAKPEAGSFAIDMTKGGQETGRLGHLLEIPSKAFGHTSEAEALIPGQSGSDRDEAAALNEEFSPNYAGTGLRRNPVLEPYAAGSPFTELADHHYYAAAYAFLGNTTEYADLQGVGTAWEINGQGPYTSWLQKFERGASEEAGNMGVRIVEAKNGHVVTTLGGGKEHEHCHIPTARIALAAGGENTVFVLTSPASNNNNEYDEIIEYAEGKGEPCPEASGELAVEGKETTRITIREHETVEFSALDVNRDGEAPYKLEWNFTDEPGVVIEPGGEMNEANGYKWPNPTAKHTFNKQGTYKAELALTGDYGITTNLTPIEVTVLPVEPPVFKINCPATIYQDEPATCNAKGSTGRNKAEPTLYRWEYPKSPPEQQTPTAEPTAEAHTWTEQGIYEITLTIYWENPTTHQTEEATAKEPITVTPEQQPSINLQVPTITANQSATITAKGSKGRNDAPITKYTWEYEPNTSPESLETPQTTHTYTNPGTTTLSLTITYTLPNSQQTQTTTTHESITIQPGAKAKTETKSEETKTTPAEQHVESNKTIEKPKQKPLTRAQKLALALKHCHKIKNHHKRAICESQAHKKYAPPTHKHKNKKQ